MRDTPKTMRKDMGSQDDMDFSALAVSVFICVHPCPVFKRVVDEPGGSPK
jgi:hypothetical protein